MTSLVHCEITPITPKNMALENLEKLKSSARDLLRLVREKYGVIAIEPQLTENHFDGIIRKLPELCPSHDFKALAESATKEILYEIAVFSPSSVPLVNPRLTEIVDRATLLGEIFVPVQPP